MITGMTTVICASTIETSREGLPVSEGRTIACHGTIIPCNLGAKLKTGVWVTTGPGCESSDWVAGHATWARRVKVIALQRYLGGGVVKGEDVS